MPPRERQHEEALGGDWGILLRLDWAPLRGHGLTTGVGQTRHAASGEIGTRGLGFILLRLGDSFSTLRERSFGAVAPLERRHTPPCGGAGEY